MLETHYLSTCLPKHQLTGFLQVSTHNFTHNHHEQSRQGGLKAGPRDRCSSNPQGSNISPLAVRNKLIIKKLNFIIHIVMLVKFLICRMCPLYRDLLHRTRITLCSSHAENISLDRKFLFALTFVVCHYNLAYMKLNL